jgi:hypothetical protein
MTRALPGCVLLAVYQLPERRVRSSVNSAAASISVACIVWDDGEFARDSLAKGKQRKDKAKKVRN